MTWLKQFPTECWWERFLCCLIFSITFTALVFNKRNNWNEPQCCFNWEFQLKLLLCIICHRLHSFEWNRKVEQQKNAFKSNKNEIHDLSLIRFNNVLYTQTLFWHPSIYWSGIVASWRSLAHSSIHSLVIMLMLIIVSLYIVRYD